MHLVAIDFCLYVVHFCPHFIDPALDDDVGLCGRIVRVMQSPKIFSNDGGFVVVLGSDDVFT